jgi:hypothetical protein
VRVGRRVRGRVRVGVTARGSVEPRHTCTEPLPPDRMSDGCASPDWRTCSRR